MQYKALVSFSGTINMAKGGIGEISDASLVGDLLKAGYIEPLEKKASKEEKPKEEKPKKKG